MSAAAVQIVTTAPNQEVAEQIASVLVEQRLAGCVQIDGPIASVFRWRGTIERESEWRLTAKTTADRMQQVESAIRKMHPYDVPEILATPVIWGSPDYLAWLAKEVEFE